MAYIQSGVRYALFNVRAPGSCLDLSGQDNYSIIGFPFHGGLNQQWLFERQQNDNVQIKSAIGLYLTVDRPPANGVKVIAGPEPFEWHAEDDPLVPQAIRLLVPGTGVNINLSNFGNPAPCTPVELWGRWEGRNQLWTLQQIGG